MVDRDTIQKYKEALAYLTARDPFFGYILVNLRAVADESVETAAVDNWGRLVINPKFFNKLSVQDRAFVIAHEAMHILTQDLERVAGKNLQLWNIVTDAWNNEALMRSSIIPSENLKRGIITFKVLERKLGIPLSLSNTKEEIYIMLPLDIGGIVDGGVLSGDLGVEPNPRAPTIYEGNPAIYARDGKLIPNATEEIVREAWAYSFHGKTFVGRYLEEGRYLEDLYMQKVLWGTFLRHTLQTEGRIQLEWKPPERPEPGESPLSGEETEEIGRMVRRGLEEILPKKDPRLLSRNTSEGYRGPEGIIIDPLAFYVPYHYNWDWGIYFRINRVIPVFLDMVRKYGVYLGIKGIERGEWLGVFGIFLNYIYWHELTHHIIEDISSVKGTRYPLLGVSEEEGLAEWHAFLTSEHETRKLWAYEWGWPCREVLRNLGGPDEMRRRCLCYHNCATPIVLIVAELAYTLYKRHRVFSKPLNPARILSVIYYHLGRDKDPVYRPIVRPSVFKKLGLLWNPVREASVHGGMVYPVQGEEIYHRIYLTQY